MKRQLNPSQPCDQFQAMRDLLILVITGLAVLVAQVAAGRIMLIQPPPCPGFVAADGACKP